MIDRKKLLSAFVTISANEGAPSGRSPPRPSLSTRRSNLSRSWAEVKPHHAGEAYSREEMVVMRATSCSWAGRILRILVAWHLAYAGRKFFTMHPWGYVWERRLRV